MATLLGALSIVAGGLTTAFTTVNKIQNDEKRKQEERDLSLSYIFTGVDSKLVQISKAKLEREPILPKLLDQLGGIQKQLNVVLSPESEVRNLVDREIYEMEKAGKNPDEIADLKAVDPGAQAFLFALSMPEGKDEIEFKLKGKHRAALKLGGVLLLRGREIFSADWSLFPEEDAKQVQILATFCRNRWESDDEKSEEKAESSPNESTAVAPAPANDRAQTPQPSPGESQADQSKPPARARVPDTSSGQEVRNDGRQEGSQATNGDASDEEAEKKRRRKQKGKEPSSAPDVQSQAPQPSHAQGSQGDTSASVDGENGRKGGSREDVVANGDAKGVVRKKRRRRGKGAGPSAVADGQAQPQQPSQEARGYLSPHAGKQNDESREGVSAVNGDAVGTTRKKNRRRREKQPSTQLPASSTTNVQAQAPQPSTDTMPAARGDPSTHAAGSGHLSRQRTEM